MKKSHNNYGQLSFPAGRAGVALFAHEDSFRAPITRRWNNMWFWIRRLGRERPAWATSWDSLHRHPSFPTKHRYMICTQLTFAQCNADNWVVQGHAGKLLFGLFELNRAPVVLMVGRVQSVFHVRKVSRGWDFSKVIMKVTPYRVWHFPFE